MDVTIKFSTSTRLPNLKEKFNQSKLHINLNTN